MTETKEHKVLKEGALDMASIEIVPSGIHTKTDYMQIADVIRGGKAFILEVHASRNTIYNIRKALINPTADWNVEPDPKNPKKTVLRKDAIKNVKFGEVKLKAVVDGKPALEATKNTALYLA